MIKGDYKKNQVWAYLSLTLVALFVAGLLAACGDNTAAPTAAATTAAASATTAAAGAQPLQVQRPRGCDYCCRSYHSRWCDNGCSHDCCRSDCGGCHDCCRYSDNRGTGTTLLPAPRRRAGGTTAASGLEPVHV